MTQRELWQDQARQLGGEALVEKLEGMADDIHAIKKSVADLATSAFPGGDVDGHRRYHTLVIERTEEIRRLRRAIQEKTVSGLIWAFLVFLGLCVYSYLTGVKTPPFPPHGG